MPPLAEAFREPRDAEPALPMIRPSAVAHLTQCIRLRSTASHYLASSELLLRSCRWMVFSTTARDGADDLWCPSSHPRCAGFPERRRSQEPIPSTPPSRGVILHGPGAPSVSRTGPLRFRTETVLRRFFTRTRFHVSELDPSTFPTALHRWAREAMRRLSTSAIEKVREHDHKSPEPGMLPPWFPTGELALRRSLTGALQSGR